MNNFFIKLYNWFVTSNHDMHFYVGCGIEMLMLLIALLLKVQLLAACILATCCVLISMITAECKDKAKGGKFDWQDILAGSISSIIILIILIIILII